MKGGIKVIQNKFATSFHAGLLFKIFLKIFKIFYVVHNQFLQEAFFFAWPWLYGGVHRILIAIHEVAMFFCVVTLSIATFLLGLHAPKKLINLYSLLLTFVFFYPWRMVLMFFLCNTFILLKPKWYPSSIYQNQHFRICKLILVWVYLGSECSHHMTGMLTHMWDVICLRRNPASWCDCDYYHNVNTKNCIFWLKNTSVTSLWLSVRFIFQQKDSCLQGSVFFIDQFPANWMLRKTM